jgi:hypothetical protein
MATYKILYWQEIPSQIVVEDDSEDCTVQLADRFQERIDLMAAKRGCRIPTATWRSGSGATGRTGGHGSRWSPPR